MSPNLILIFSLKRKFLDLICYVWLVVAIESIYYNDSEYKMNEIELKLYLFVYAYTYFYLTHIYFEKAIRHAP